MGLSVDGKINGMQPMLLLGRMLTMAMALLGGIFVSQAPEFAQQYRQRIGGALDELRAIITRFDDEASRNGLDRQAALGLYATSAEQFLRAQGDAMRHSFNRYQTLEQQSRDLEQASPLAKPLVILRNPDPELVTNAWRDFAPGIPVTLAGLAWGGVGLVTGWLAAALLGTASLRAARRRPRTRAVPYQQVPQEELARQDNPRPQISRGESLRVEPHPQDAPRHTV